MKKQGQFQHLYGSKRWCKQARLEFLYYKQLVTRDREQMAEIHRMRMLTLAQLASPLL